ncbi:hypothetical protein SLS54_008911 [Diplodia seriata]
MDEIAPGIYECVALSSLPSRGAPSNSDTPPDSFRTRDLFAAHPTHADWWRYLARLDDRLALTNGEKMLPLPIEGAVRQCRHVAEATMRMWSLIRKTLDLGLRRDELGQNVVYEKGNVKTLARHLYALRTGEAMGQSDEDELLAMQELVDEFSAFDPHVPGDLPAPDGEVVTFHWTRDFVPALRRTGMLPPFEVVSPAEWLEKLRDSDPDVQRNPSRKLLGFWEGKYGREVTGKKTLEFQTGKTLEMAPRLGEVPMADILRDDEWLGRVVRRWVSSW